MKIRSSFVSNSSSSSFVFIGKPVTDESVGRLVDGGALYAFGREINDGDDFFAITDEMLPIVSGYDFELFHVAAILDRDVGSHLGEGYHCGDFRVYDIDRDFRFTRSLGDLIESYRGSEGCAFRHGAHVELADAYGVPDVMVDEGLVVYGVALEEYEAEVMILSGIDVIVDYPGEFIRLSQDNFYDVVSDYKGRHYGMALDALRFFTADSILFHYDDPIPDYRENFRFYLK